MAGIGEDFKEIYRDTGRNFVVVHRDGTESVTEFGKTKTNSQATKPFTVMTTMRAFFPYDTEVRAGDVVRYLDDNSLHLVTVSKPSILEGQIKYFSGILYAANAVFRLRRKPEVPVRDAKGDLVSDWQPVTGEIFANLSDTDFGSELVEDRRSAPFGDVRSNSHTLYIPAPWVVDDKNKQLFLDIADQISVRPLNATSCWPQKRMEVTGVRQNRYDNVHALDVRQVS